MKTEKMVRKKIGANWVVLSPVELVLADRQCIAYEVVKNDENDLDVIDSKLVKKAQSF